MIALPTTPGPVSLDWQEIDFGGVLSPPLGGTDQRLNRLGNRWQLTVQLPPMAPQFAGPWISALSRGLREGVRWNIRQVEMEVAALASCAVAGAPGAGGVSIPVATSSAYTFKAGQAVTFVSGETGRRYVHLVHDPVAITSTGTLTFNPPVRYDPAVSDIILVTQPTIEGFLIGDGLSWTVDRARRVGLTFAIRERA